MAILTAGGEIILAWCVVEIQIGASCQRGRWDKPWLRYVVCTSTKLGDVLAVVLSEGWGRFWARFLPSFASDSGVEQINLHVCLLKTNK